MATFLIKRLGQLVIVMLAISFIAFAIQSQLGDPVSQLSGLTTSEADKELLREQLGLKDPFLVQYVRYLGNALHGDFGTSYFYKQKNLSIILEKLPATIELVLAASLIIIMFSLPLGVYSAIHPNHWLTKCIMGFSIIGISIPVFLTAILLLFVFSQWLGWLPSYGRGDVVFIGKWWTSGLVTFSGIQHIILPAISLASVMLPLFVRLVRSEMMESLGQEYIRFARAKGLKDRTIHYKHALRNTLLPVITVGGVQLGTMIAYTILTEKVFQWPGMGFMFLEAVNYADISLITSYIVFVGFIFVVINTLVDILYSFIDPRVTISRSNA